MENYNQQKMQEAKEQNFDKLQLQKELKTLIKMDKYDYDITYQMEEHKEMIDQLVLENELLTLQIERAKLEKLNKKLKNELEKHANFLI
jgi:hypothetical protein